MQKFTLSFFLLFVTVACIAQGNLPRTYDYDNAGNRILRTTLTIRQVVVAEADTSFADVSNSIFILDLSRYENGVYLLTLTLNGQTDTCELMI